MFACYLDSFDFCLFHSIFHKVLLEAPAITDNALYILRRYCVDEVSCKLWLAIFDHYYYIPYLSYIGIHSKVLYNFKSIIMNDTHVITTIILNIIPVMEKLIKDTVREMGSKRTVSLLLTVVKSLLRFSCYKWTFYGISVSYAIFIKRYGRLEWTRDILKVTVFVSLIRHCCVIRYLSELVSCIYIYVCVYVYRTG